jgi:hypothetical protein
MLCVLQGPWDALLRGSPFFEPTLFLSPQRKVSLKVSWCVCYKLAIRFLISLHEPKGMTMANLDRICREQIEYIVAKLKNNLPDEWTLKDLPVEAHKYIAEECGVDAVYFGEILLDARVVGRKTVEGKVIYYKLDLLNAPNVVDLVYQHVVARRELLRDGRRKGAGIENGW